MKAFVAFAAVVSVVLAQSSASVADLPACAQTCYANAFTNGSAGSCTTTDIACLCSNTAFIQNVTTCVEGACSGSDLAAAATFAQAQCAAVSAAPSGSASASLSSVISSASEVASSATSVLSSVSSTPAPSSSASSAASSASMSSYSSIVPPPNSGANKVVAGVGVGAAAVAAFFL